MASHSKAILGSISLPIVSSAVALVSTVYSPKPYGTRTASSLCVRVFPRQGVVFGTCPAGQYLAPADVDGGRAHMAADLAV